MASDSALTSGSFEEQAYLKYALHVPSMEAEQQRLARSLEAVEEELRALISQCHEPLIDDLQSMSGSQRQLENVKTDVQRMCSTSQRLKYTIEEPCATVEAKVVELRNLMKTVETMRQVQRFLSLLGKLQDAMQGDPLRAARALRELEECLGRGETGAGTSSSSSAEVSDLNGIAVVDNYLGLVNTASATIRTKALETLRSSISHTSPNVVDCGAALQVFYTLETLPKVIASVFSDHKRDASVLVVKELDPSTLPTGGEDLKEAVFHRMEESFQGIAAHMSALGLLWKTLHRKRDPLTQHLFATALYPDPSVGRTTDASMFAQDFWVTVSTNLSDRIAKLTRNPSVHGILVSEFPRFQRLVFSFGDSISDFLRETKRSLESTDAQLALLRVEDLVGGWSKKVLSALRDGFTAHHADRMREKLQPVVLKIQNSIPTAATESVPKGVAMDLHRHANLPPQVTSMDPRAFLKHIVTEVATHRRDATILSIQLVTFSQGLQQLYQKLTSALSQVPLTAIPPIHKSMTGGGLFHTALANCAALVSSEIATMLSTLPSGSANTATGATSTAAGSASMARQSVGELGPLIAQLNEQCAAFSELSNKILNPYFAAAGQAFSKHVTSLVLDGEGLNDDAAMQAFETRLHDFLSHYALLFDRATNAEALRQQLAMNILRRFAATVVVVRPMPESLRGVVGRRVMELQTLLAPLAALDRHREARDLLGGFRKLYFCSPSEIATEATVGAIHPLFPILHYFQRVDETLLPSVHTAMRKTPVELAENLFSVLGQPTLTAATPMWDAVERCLKDFETRPDDSLGEAMTPKDRKAILEGCRRFGVQITSAITI